MENVFRIEYNSAGNASDKCTTPSQCPNTNSSCIERTCINGVCGTQPVPNGSPLTAQTHGDCRVNLCDSAGNVYSATDDTDTPDDGNPCSDGICNDGVPSILPKPIGSPCISGGIGGVCDGASACIECQASTDCVPSSKCVFYECKNSTCQATNIAAGTVPPDQPDGDCRRIECDGAGNEVDFVDDTDTPYLENPCAYGECSNGAPSTAFRSSGTPCGTNLSCNSTGECIRPPSITGGSDHNCGLTALGGVLCWGDNRNSQLGNGTSTNASFATPVSNLGSGVVAVSAGSQHTCALTEAGAVLCWGLNDNGQLGNGSTIGSPIPTQVSGLEYGVSAISAGYYHTCAITSAGALRCWGLNQNGQLGIGSNSDVSTPTPVSGLGSGVAAVSAGGYHTCAIVSGGRAMCWGVNWYGQVGDATQSDQNTPAQVLGLASDVSAISAGYYHTCAVASGGRAVCWGDNDYGQMGNNDTEGYQTTPMQVFGLASGVKTISSGYYHNCVTTSSDETLCWGSNFRGQVGDGTTDQRLVPTHVSGIVGSIITIQAAEEHTCAVVAPDTARCWGYNAYGQIGDGTDEDKHVPTLVVGFP